MEDLESGRRSAHMEARARQYSERGRMKVLKMMRRTLGGQGRSERAVMRLSCLCWAVSRVVFQSIPFEVWIIPRYLYAVA
jgi:hypothetical protein